MLKESMVIKMTIIVPDTSIIVDGRLSWLVESGEYESPRLLIPEAALAEIEHMANQGRASGFTGLEELKKLRKMCSEGLVDIEFFGRRPETDELHDIDAIIRESAPEVNGILVTGDKVQASIAKAKGIDVILLRPILEESRIPRIYDYFDENTMSVHLKEKVVPLAKRGKPGDFKLVKISETPMTYRDISTMAREIIEFAKQDSDSFIEIERQGATVVQLRQIRIAIARPPFSDGYEITAVTAVAEVTLEDYSLSQELIERLRSRAEGVLVAGPPGAGKSTFSQALAEFYREQGKIVKTMESPRDLIVSDEITQYAPLEGDMEKTADILLLVRPDYTIYDEVRKTRDFRIFADMRLAGVGMVGVTHATKAIDAVQRMIGRVELGMIPQIADTIIFIKDGQVNTVYKVKLSVKVPSGMIEADLARPMIEVKNFESDNTEYEIYTFGEETVVMPVTELEQKTTTPVEKLAREKVIQEIKKSLPKAEFEAEFKGNTCILWVEERYLPKIIGRKGKNIDLLEKKLGIRIDVRNLNKISKKDETKDRLDVEIGETKNYLTLVFNKAHAGKMVKVYGNDKYFFTATISRKGEIKIGKKTELGEAVKKTIESEGEIYAQEV